MRELGRVPITLSRSALAKAWSMGITVYGDVPTRRGRSHGRDDRGISR